MMRAHFRFFILFVGLILPFMIGASAHAQEDASDLVKVRLLPEYSRVEAGQEIWIGIEQSIAPHWHTYWRNPGDSGSAPRIEWQAPDGFTFGEIQWPAPKKLPFGPLLNYGYEDHVILLQKLALPDSLPEGPITLNAVMEILVCKEECVPAFSEHEIVLNDPSVDPENNQVYLQAALDLIPEEVVWSAFFKEKEGLFHLSVKTPNQDKLDSIDPFSVTFYLQDWGIVENGADAYVTLEDEILTFSQPRGERPLDMLQHTGVVLAYVDNDGATKSIALKATHKEFVPETPPEKLAKLVEETSQSAITESDSDSSVIWQALLFAFLGGLILNLMPCVFPVLSMKALSLVKISEKSAGLARLHGLSYTVGVVVSFLAIAGVLIVLKSVGYDIGWGFQLQNPMIVSLLAYLLFIIGLNLSGVFEFGDPFANTGQKLTETPGMSGSFFTGVLATLVATPCTAPFMAAAIGFAVTQTALVNFSVFAALGLGLAAPYLLLSFTPALYKALPKPGPWMVRFKEFLAFPMFASAAWLVWVVAKQVGPESTLGLLFGMVFLAFGFWLWRAVPAAGLWRRVVQVISIISILLCFGLITKDRAPAEEIPASADIKEFGSAYTPDALAQALASDDPVFVEMTADWCITCKVNNRIAINVPATRTLFKERNVRFIVGDWTKYDEAITKFLEIYGRNGVPIYVYYGAPDEKTGERPEPQLLPQLLTPGIVAEYVGLG